MGDIETWRYDVSMNGGAGGAWYIPGRGDDRRAMITKQPC